MSNWTLVDNTSPPNLGYLQIQCDGQRVADAFPYAAGADPSWVRVMAERIVDLMNAAQLKPRSYVRAAVVEGGEEE